jgi:hypothetical protein
MYTRRSPHRQEPPWPLLGPPPCCTHVARLLRPTLARVALAAGAPWPPGATQATLAVPPSSQHDPAIVCHHHGTPLQPRSASAMAMCCHATMGCLRANRALNQLRMEPLWPRAVTSSLASPSRAELAPASRPHRVLCSMEEVRTEECK